MCTFHAFLYDNFFSHDKKLPIRHSTLQLSKVEADVAIRFLLGRAKPKAVRYYGAGGANLSQNQAREIARLEAELGWASNPRRLQGFVKRQTGGLSAVEMLSNRKASKVITVMKKILADGEKQKIKEKKEA